MDKKTLYAFLMIIIFIIIWFGKEAVKTKEQPFSREINQGQENMKEESATPGYAQDIPSVVNNSPGITIIKKDRKLPFIERQADSKAEKKETLDSVIGKDQKPANPYVPSGQSDYSSGEAQSNNSSFNMVSGVTKLNKRPTEEESQEMNAHGIILY